MKLPQSVSHHLLSAQPLQSEVEDGNHCISRFISVKTFCSVEHILKSDLNLNIIKRHFFKIEFEIRTFQSSLTKRILSVKDIFHQVRAQDRDRDLSISIVTKIEHFNRHRRSAISTKILINIFQSNFSRQIAAHEVFNYPKN